MDIRRRKKDVLSLFYLLLSVIACGTLLINGFDLELLLIAILLICFTIVELMGGLLRERSIENKKQKRTTCNVEKNDTKTLIVHNA